MQTFAKVPRDRGCADDYQSHFLIIFIIFREYISGSEASSPGNQLHIGSIDVTNLSIINPTVFDHVHIDHCFFMFLQKPFKFLGFK